MLWRLVSLVAGLSVGIACCQTPAQLPAQTYVLGPDDQVTIQVVEADEINGKMYRVDEKGNLDLPMIGSLNAAGLTVHEVEKQVTDKLRVYIREPQVTVFLNEMRSQPVSVIGAVNTPGVHQLQGHKTLIEMLSLAGGLRQDAGYRIKITRHREWGMIPAKEASIDPTGQFSVAEVSLKGLMEASTPEDNVAIMPNDVISVPVAEMIYVVGDVRKSGGFVLGERNHVTVLQALAMAEGLDRAAKVNEARILRATSGSDTRTEVLIDLKKILAGKAGDVDMRSNDILFIPTDALKSIGARTLESMFSIGSGMAIYRPF
jgi:polysaccharide export outer membrane protein